MKVKEAEAITGGLSNPSKMPGRAFGISALRCHRGSKLREVQGSVCAACYAMRGRYRIGPVPAAQENRYQKFLATPRDQWIEAMATDIASKCRAKPWFRWFDSGDLQSFEMLQAINEVCKRVPQVRFWMSTRERQFVNRLRPVEKAGNLVIRVSADLIGQEPPKGFEHTSATLHCPSKAMWKDLIRSTQGSWLCPAPLQDNKCGTCRACWDPATKDVTYRQH